MRPLRDLRVLISGAGVAGPALAYWLSRCGAEVTVIEVASALRTSGFPVDFRGPTHLGVLAKMGVLDDLRELRTHGGAMIRVDEHDREIFRLPAEFAGGDIEIHRRDLSRVLYEHTADRAGYLFGDTITHLTRTSGGVHVGFAGAASRTFDLVVGADGSHSGVRRIVFGPQDRFVRHLNYYVAGWELPNEMGAGTASRQYNVPGRMVSVTADPRNPDRAGAFAVFAAPRLDHDRHDPEQQKKLVGDALHGLPWHVPRLLDGLSEAPELYFDSINRVTVPQWSSGRVALLGDAAWGVTLGGMGVGTGIVGAYVLAGELAAAGGKHDLALASYENRMRRYAATWQRGANPGPYLAPPTRARLRVRDALFKNRLVRRLLVAGTTSLATDVELPDYPV